jgi:oligoendopeptidase F
MRAKQNALSFSTPLSTAEVASTFMEDFVLKELLKEANNELKLSILMKKLNDDISTIYRQVAAYKFEQELHQAFREKGYLSYKDIGTLFQKNMAAYMGPAIEQSKGSENWWIYWNHIRSFFYVYSYASGLLISKSLQYSVAQDPTFISTVKNFLSAGSSESPVKIFKAMNIDITDKNFWAKGLQEIDALLNETETLAQNLHKI